MIEKRIGLLQAIAIFVAATAYFFILLFTLLPFLKTTFSINPALYWFITGYFLFIPLFVFALIMVRVEGSHGIKQIMLALHIKSFQKKEWAYSIIGLFLVFAVTALIFGISSLLNKYYGIRPLRTMPWFMEFNSFEGGERLLLLVWLPMFFFNIVGEEILWRGYIQARLKCNYAWLLCSLLWLIFHLPFGLELMIIALPAVVIIPYAFYRTQNTLVAIFIHGIYNGPIFIAVALGFIK